MFSLKYYSAVIYSVSVPVVLYATAEILDDSAFRAWGEKSFFLRDELVRSYTHRNSWLNNFLKEGLSANMTVERLEYAYGFVEKLRNVSFDLWDRSIKAEELGDYLRNNKVWTDLNNQMEQIRTNLTDTVQTFLDEGRKTEKRNLERMKSLCDQIVGSYKEERGLEMEMDIIETELLRRKRQSV